jgi:hypothetical protein
MSVEQLKNRDFYLVIDRSGSMGDTDTPTGQSRWDYARESTETIAKKLQEYDPDGITVVPFGTSFKTYPNTTASKVKDVFQENSPMGGTILSPALQWCFDDYWNQKQANKAKANGAMVVVITDGMPSDANTVAQTITTFANKLSNPDQEFGIAMLQIGKDPGATAFLKSLDDDLVKQGAKHDIVDTKTMEQVEQMGLTEALLAALTD